MDPQCFMAYFALFRPTAVTNFREGGGRGDSRSLPFLVDDVHLARITDGVGGWKMTLGGEKKGSVG